MNASEDFEALTASTELSPSLYLQACIEQIGSALTFPVSQPSARQVAASSHPFILFIHKERVVGKSMQPEPHPVSLNLWK